MRRLVIKNMLLFVCALTIFASCEQTKNRQVENEQIEIANDSIQTYINQARNLDADAYVKLADCYHRGIGVEHNFAMMMHMLWLADLYSREEGLAWIKYIETLPEDDADRLTYEALSMVSNRQTEEARAITERLLKVSSQAGKVLQAVLAIEESRDTTSFQRLINEGISEGYLLSSVVLARRYSFDKKEDAAVKVWESIADRVPLVCSYIGEYYQKQNNIKKSTEYYKKADQWACLSIKGAGFLLDDILYRQGKFSIRDRKEENRLRQIRDGKDR